MIQELNIIKRDGKTVKFDKNKIENILLKNMLFKNLFFLKIIGYLK